MTGIPLPCLAPVIPPPTNTASSPAFTLPPAAASLRLPARFNCPDMIRSVTLPPRDLVLVDVGLGPGIGTHVECAGNVNLPIQRDGVGSDRDLPIRRQDLDAFLVASVADPDLVATEGFDQFHIVGAVPVHIRRLLVRAPQCPDDDGQLYAALLESHQYLVLLFRKKLESALVSSHESGNAGRVRFCVAGHSFKSDFDPPFTI